MQPQPIWILFLNASSTRILTVLCRSCIQSTVSFSLKSLRPHLDRSSRREDLPRGRAVTSRRPQGLETGQVSRSFLPHHSCAVYLCCSWQPFSPTLIRNAHRIGNGAIDHIQLVNFLSWLSWSASCTASFPLRSAPEYPLKAFVTDHLRISMVNCKCNILAFLPVRVRSPAFLDHPIDMSINFSPTHTLSASGWIVYT
jgi:hypothetical protein